MARHYLFLSAIALVFISCALHASALSISADKADYNKGEAINIEGICAPGKNTLSIAHHGRIVFGREINCETASLFRERYEIGFLDPAGRWNIAIENGGESSETSALIWQIPESAYFVVKFLSPPPGTYYRTDGLPVTVRITDAGVPVTDANAALWAAGGARIQLENRGSGLYRYDYEIPYDAMPGKWRLVVTAERNADARHGGEAGMDIKVGKAPISIDVIEPAVRTFSLGAEIPLKVKVGYVNGKPIAEGAIKQVAAEIGGRAVLLTPQGKGIYSGVLRTRGEDEGVVGIIITAEDLAGNFGDTTLNIVATGLAGWYLSEYAVYILAAIMVLAIFVRVVYGGISRKGSLRKLEEERSKTAALIRGLQKEYFENRRMPAESYKKRIAEHRANINMIDAKVREIKDREGLK
ncbi:MAG: hypothetical protein ABH854_05650 [Candidatus Diapherotrites archaeon]